MESKKRFLELLIIFITTYIAVIFLSYFGMLKMYKHPQSTYCNLFDIECDFLHRRSTMLTLHGPFILYTSCYLSMGWIYFQVIK